MEGQKFSLRTDACLDLLLADSLGDPGFNDGNFSEDSTFLITDWFNHTPKGGAGREFWRSRRDLRQDRPQGPVDLQRALPGSLDADLPQSNQPFVPNPYAFPLGDQKPNFQSAGGSVRIADSTNFPATTMAAALVEIAPGGMRELHWHPLSDEWQYYISGTARMGVFHGEGRNNTVEFHPSDVGLCAAVDRPLCPEHRQGHAALPRSVHIGEIRRYLAGVMDEQCAA